MTLEALRAFGANTDEGMNRCMNNEAFYFRLIGMAGEDASFERLAKAVEENDLDAAFEAAHALKGVMGNLALTPIFTPASQLTELLRAKTPGDYAAYLRQILAKREELRALCQG